MLKRTLIILTWHKPGGGEKMGNLRVKGNKVWENGSNSLEK